MSKPVYTGEAILNLSKALMYEFYYDYMQPINGSKVKPYYMDRDSFVYRDIANNVEIRFDTSRYSKDDSRPLPVEKNQKGYRPDEKWN